MSTTDPGGVSTSVSNAAAPHPAAGPESRALYERARRVIPGGVNSPVRAYGAVGGTPLFIERAAGARLVDVDGREYLDFVGSWGPLILGHAHPEVIDAVHTAANAGTTYGAPCRAEVELAEAIVAAYPGLEQVRCVSSGTEAVMSAVRLARAATGREVIVKFSGCYHGHADHLLVAAGSGLATFGRPSSLGVPDAFAGLTRVVPLDDEAALAALFAREGDRIAAVLIEPVPANHGLLLQRPAFLRSLRELTARHGALLVFDEVISGFRVARGGAAELYGVVPDLATFGKIIGGGMPVGAFGGRRALMEQLAPLGGVYQAGTLSGNPVAMTAGLATLRVLERENAWARLEALGAALERALAPALAGAPRPVQLVRLGSIFWLALQAGAAPRGAEAVEAAAAARYGGFFHRLLAGGVALAPSAYEVGFLSLAHREADVEQLASVIASALDAERMENVP
jgi:glutamate-1-semialdehyde 2,1-aminomutase